MLSDTDRKTSTGIWEISLTGNTANSLGSRHLSASFIIRLIQRQKLRSQPIRPSILTWDGRPCATTGTKCHDAGRKIRPDMEPCTRRCRVFHSFHKGSDIIGEVGRCWYKLPEYRNYFFQSEAHNVVLFDGKGQPRHQQYHSSPIAGNVSNLIDTLGIRYVLADATGPNSDRFNRYLRSFCGLTISYLSLTILRAMKKAPISGCGILSAQPSKRG